MILFFTCHFGNTVYAILQGESRRSLIFFTDKISLLPEKTITICTFNIQFLGAFKKRDNHALASLLNGYEIILIQEMVATPVDGIYPDGSRYTADPESKNFMNEMLQNGYQFLLSEEDTGAGKKGHTAGTSTEWFIAFYDPSSVQPAPDLPHGFLAADRTHNPDYDRVPYAFPFRLKKGKNDFVLISVHLAPGEGEKPEERRKQEINSIYHWINIHNQREKDFLIAGDMNIENKKELSAITPDHMVSLNDECRRTNTLINHTPPDYGAKPYDQVFYFPEYSRDDIDASFDCKVIDLVSAMKPYWHQAGPYPGKPYHHDLFRQYYSDHDPLIFRIRILDYDED